MLTDITLLLNAYLKKKKQLYFDTMILCFETMTEYIQGPCKLNQEALIQGSFLNLAADVLKIDTLKQNMIKSAKRSGFATKNAKLKQKTKSVFSKITSFNLFTTRKKRDKKKKNLNLLLEEW